MTIDGCTNDIHFRGKLSVIDWKTSYKPRPHLKDMYDGPTQAVAYAGAVNSDCRYPFVVSGHVFSGLSLFGFVCMFVYVLIVFCDSPLNQVCVCMFIM